MVNNKPITVLPIFLSPTSPAFSLDVVLVWLELQVRDLGANFGDDVSDSWSTESDIDCRVPRPPVDLFELTDCRAVANCTESYKSTLKNTDQSSELGIMK